MGRCQHEPISLFDKPMPDDEKAAVQYFLSGYAPFWGKSNFMPSCAVEDSNWPLVPVCVRGPV